MAKVKFALTPYPLQQEIIDYADGKYKNPEGEDYRFLVVVIGRQSGKALDVNTEILTTDGWKTMGTVQAGDYVFGEDGKPTRVLWASDVQYDRPCYDIEFSDGTHIVADAEHQWEGTRGEAYTTESLTVGVEIPNIKSYVVVVSIVPVSPVPVRCIAVDNDSKLFVVTRAFIATHNSWLAKYTQLERAINRGQTCLWVSPAITTARTHWDGLVNLVETSGMPVRKIAQASKQIVFTNGGEINVRSAVIPDNLRGVSADFIVLDEAAFFPKGEYTWYSVIMPMITATGGKVLFTSTPNGRNWFWKVYVNGQNPNELLYKSWRATSADSPYQDKKLLANIKASIPEYQWLEEYEAEFLADSTGVFSGSDKAAQVTQIDVPLDGHSYVCGIDFGFNHDATTITMIDKYTHEQVFGKRFFNFGTAGTIRKLVSVLNIWQPEVTHLEKNGLGEALFDILKGALNGDPDIPETLLLRDTTLSEGEFDSTAETPWTGKLKAIHMNNQMKRSLVERTAADIEYGRLKILAATEGTYGETQINEMSTYKRERTQSGLDVTYNAEEGSYDDTISALYLANKGMPKARSWQDRLSDDKPTINPFKAATRRHLRNR